MINERNTYIYTHIILTESYGNTPNLVVNQHMFHQYWKRYGHHSVPVTLIHLLGLSVWKDWMTVPSTLQCFKKHTYIYILLIWIPPISQFLLDFPEQMMTVPAEPGSRVHIGIINKNSLLWVLKSMIVMRVTTCFETHTIHIHIHIHWENDHISQQQMLSVGSTL